MKRKSILLLLIWLLVLTGCRKEEETPEKLPIEKPPVEQEEEPVVQQNILRVEISKGGLSTAQLTDAVKTLPELLRNALATAGVNVETVKVTVGASPAATAETLAKGNVDLAFLPAEEYLLYGGEARALLADGEQADGAGVGSLICAAPTEYGGQLKQRAEKGPTWNELARARWGVLEEDSLAGYRGFDLWLADNYEGNRLADLPKVTVYESYEAVLRGAAAEEIDAFVIRDDAREDFADAWTQDLDRADEGGLRGFGRTEPIWTELPVLAETERLYTTVAAVSSGYAADVEKLQAALSALAEESPEQMLVLGARQFAPVQDDQLNPQRRLLTLES